MTAATQEAPTRLIVRIGQREHEVPTLGARRGAKALHILLPYVTALRGALGDVAFTTDEKTPQQGIEIILKVIAALHPLMEPDTYLDLVSALIGLPVEEIENEPFFDVATALAQTVGKLDVGALLSASSDVYTQVVKMAAEGEAPKG